MGDSYLCAALQKSFVVYLADKEVKRRRSTFGRSALRSMAAFFLYVDLWRW